ncbi:MAG: hypothetical protein P4L16_07825 [Chlamydiales bacterium]|nr:hypothetical protein [Chlamydiales bacterium]
MKKMIQIVSLVFVCSIPLFSQQVREVNIWDQLAQRVSNDLGVNKIAPLKQCQECSSIDSVGEYAVVGKKSGKSLMDSALEVIQESNLSTTQKKVLIALISEDTSFAGVTIIGDNLPNLLWAYANAVVIATSEGLNVLAEEIITGINDAGMKIETFTPNEQQFISNGVNILKEALAIFSQTVQSNIVSSYNNPYTTAYKIFQGNPELQIGGGLITVNLLGTPLVLYFNQIKAYNDLFMLANSNFDFQSAVSKFGENGKYLALLYNAGTIPTQAKLTTLLKYAKPFVVEDFVLRAKYHGADKNVGQLDYIIGKVLGDTLRANLPADFGKLMLPIQIINSNYATPAGAEQTMNITTLVAELQL